MDITLNELYPESFFCLSYCL